MLMEWKIKNTGRLFYLLLFTSFCFGIVMLYAIYVSIKYGVNLKIVLLGFSIFGFLFVLAWLFTFPILILRKKIPKRITLDTEAKQLVLHYRKKETKFKLESLAYNAHHYKYHSTLNLYFVYRSSRGHWIHKRAISLIGVHKNIGWHSKLIHDIDNQFIELEIPHFTERDRSFFSHILGN